MTVKTCFALLLLPLAGALACASSVQMTGQWVNKEMFQPGKYSSMFIVVLSQNARVKQVIENDLAYEATSRGIKTVRSSELFKPDITPENAASKEALLAKVRDLRLETIFTVVLKDTKTETRYVPGSNMYTPAPYYGGYSGYYNSTYSAVYTPGYYTEDKTYFVESNLYDVATEKLLWSVQSEVINPGKVEEVAPEYTGMLLDALDKEGLLRKKK